MSLDLIETPQPHFIPGYTGHIPQYSYRVGDTFGTTTHKLLIDPCISHAENLVLSDNRADNYDVYRPSKRDIELVKEREKQGDVVFKHPIIPGYDGLVPKIQGRFGQTFTVNATEGIANFERDMEYKRCKDRKMEVLQTLQATDTGGRHLGERSLTTNNYRLPLKEVRPEREAVIREPLQGKLPDGTEVYYNRNTPPHFMDDDDPEKFMLLGYAGLIPCNYSKFGGPNKLLTHSALCDFSSEYYRNKSMEWAPITNNTIVSTDTKTKNPFEIYPRESGMIPNYSGHIPGMANRFGKTFWESTKNAKRWLQGDFSD